MLYIINYIIKYFRRIKLVNICNKIECKKEVIGL